MIKPDLTKAPFAQGLFPTEMARIQVGWCAVCSEPVKEEDFHDSISKREYSISGLCQKCQDEVFAEGED